MQDYKNNPFMDMFKKSMENPMSMWSPENWTKMMETVQSADMYKNFNPAVWMEVPNKMFENMPWMNQKNNFNFAENMKNVETFADMHKLSLEGAQAMLRRQAEIIQKHSNDLYKLMQNMVSSPNPEAAMNMQAEYMQATFDSLVADFKELSEMFAKANLEHFEVASGKVSEHMKKMRNYAKCTASECHSKEESCAKDNKKEKK